MQKYIDILKNNFLIWISFFEKVEFESLSSTCHFVYVINETLYRTYQDYTVF